MGVDDPHATPDRAAKIKEVLLEPNENGGTRRWDDDIDVLVARIEKALGR